MENSTINKDNEMRKNNQFPYEHDNLASRGNDQIMNDPFKQYINSLKDNNFPSSEKAPNFENNNNDNNQNNLPSLEQIESASGFNAKPSKDNLTYYNPISNNLEKDVNEIENKEKKFVDLNSVANRNLNFNENQSLLNNNDNINHINLANRGQTEIENQLAPNGNFYRVDSIPEAPIPIGISAQDTGAAYPNYKPDEKPNFESKKFPAELGKLGEPASYDGNKSIVIEGIKSYKMQDIYNIVNNNYNNDKKPNIEMNLINKANIDNLNASPLSEDNKYDTNVNYENTQRPLNTENNIPFPKIQADGGREISDSTIEAVNKKIGLIYCIYHWFIFVLCSVVTVLIYILQSNLKYSEGYFYQDIYKSWNQNIISSIYTTGCLNQKENLIQEEWPGTNQGCSCLVSTRVGSCSRKSACSNVYARDPIPFNFWRGTRFCRKTEDYWQNKTYFDLDVKASPTDCANGSRSCGIIDSIGNHLCVENSRPCPTNFIKFYNSYDFETDVKKLITSDDNVINISNGVLVFSNKNENNLKIPVDFKISNGQPCLNPYYQNVGKVYVLDIYANRNYCLKFTDSNDNMNNGTTLISGQFFFDNNYQEIDKIFMESLYIENGITQITSKLPSFPKDIYKRDISLYSRNYFGLKISCYNNIKKNNMAKDLMEDLTIISKLVENSSAGLLTITIIMVVFVLALIFLCYAVKSKKKKSDKSVKLDRCIFCFYFVMAVITMGLMLAILIWLAVILSSVKFTPAFDLVFNDPNCVDSFGLELYQQLIPNVSFVRKSTVASIIMAGIAFIMIIIYSCIGYFKTGENESLYD